MATKKFKKKTKKKVIRRPAKKRAAPENKMLKGPSENKKTPPVDEPMLMGSKIYGIDHAEPGADQTATHEMGGPEYQAPLPLPSGNVIGKAMGIPMEIKNEPQTQEENNGEIK